VKGARIALAEFNSRVATARLSGDVVRSVNMAYEYSSRGEKAGNFLLLREPNHDDEDVAQAQIWLRDNHEVGLNLIRVPKAPAPIPVSATIREARHPHWKRFLLS